MAIDVLNAAVPIETSGFVPTAGMPEEAAADGTPTLDAALMQSANAGAGPADAAAERTALRAEAAVADLWVGHGASVNAIPHQTDAIHTVGMGMPFPPLSIHEKQWVADGGRYGDSTEDYAWTEMSSGDWDWATTALASSAQSDIKTILQTSSSVEEAQQRVHQYFLDHGISSGAQVYNSNAVWGPEADVVVTGHPPPPSAPIVNFDLMGGPGAGGTGGTGGSTNPYNSTPYDFSPVPDNNPDGPDVAIDVHNEANRAHVEHSAATLKATIEILDAKFNALSNSAQIVMKDGTIVTGADVKAWWASLDFRVTDIPRANGVGGAVHNGVSNIGWDVVDGWNASGPTGLAFIILHEVVHNSSFGEHMAQLSFNLHLATGGTAADYDPTDFWWDVNEESANWGARSIMDMMGMTPPENPTYGYEDTLHSWQLYPPPPFPGDGGGSGGSGGGGFGGGGTIGE